MGEEVLAEGGGRGLDMRIYCAAPRTLTDMIAICFFPELGLKQWEVPSAVGI